jgi:MFS family permease
MTTRTKATGHAWYVCFVLLLAFAFNYVDRNIIAILVEPLKRTFTVDDTTIGLLQGGAFSIFYVLFSLPLARVADRGNRRNLLLAGVLVWCGATACCGLAHTVAQLFVGRIAVAIGEAVLMPSAVSILSDYFPPRQRARALSIFSIGPYLGGAIATAGGGALLHALGSSPVAVPLGGVLAPWRIVFLVVGVAGLILLPLLSTVREPVRYRDDGSRAEESASVKQVVEQFRRNRAALSTVILGFSCVSMAAQTLQAWVPTLFIRTHGWDVKYVGVRLGIMAVLLGPVGAILGGVMADLLARRGRVDAKMILGGFGSCACFVASVTLTLKGDSIAMAGVALVYFFVGFTYGLSQAAIADLMPNRMRGQTTAIYSLVNNLLAATVGPLLVGFLTDRVFHDPMKIALSMRIVLPAAFLIAASLLWAGRGYVVRTIADNGR